MAYSRHIPFHFSLHHDRLLVGASEQTAGALDVGQPYLAGVGVGAVLATTKQCDSGSGISTGVGHRGIFRDRRDFSIHSRVLEKAYETTIGELVANVNVKRGCRTVRDFLGK